MSSLNTNSRACVFIGGPKAGCCYDVLDEQAYVVFEELPHPVVTPQPPQSPMPWVATRHEYRRTSLNQFVYDGPGNKLAEVKP